MHKFTFLDNTANFVLNSSFLETHHPSQWLSNTLFERLFLPEKSDKLQNQYIVCHKHGFLMVVITTGHFALPNYIQHFFLVDFPLYV